MHQYKDLYTTDVDIGDFAEPKLVGKEKQANRTVMFHDKHLEISAQVSGWI